MILKNSTKMPVLFIGHGSPMNAVAENDYTRSLNALQKELPVPQAILMISAHWMTKNSCVTHMQQPKTIHDFYGFPAELFSIQYPAKGSPQLAEALANHISDPRIEFDDTEWGMNLPIGKQSHPSWDHYYPLLYILGASDPQDSLNFIYEEIQNASISMRSFVLG
jgi:aromatic ring-opening dioxygenase catalytic subunit (LigB family)